MKYSVILEKFDNSCILKVYLQNQNGSIDYYKFKSNIRDISNLPNITKMFGEVNLGYSEGDYYLHPIGLDGIETGNFNIIEEQDKFKKINFANGEILNGIWIIRKTNDGRYLLWKPNIDNLNCPAMSFDKEIEGEGIQVTQQYATFNNIIGEFEFEGIGITSGIVVGLDEHPTLVTPVMVRSMFKQMKLDQDKLFVDYDHRTLTPSSVHRIDSLVNEGSITNLELIDNNKLTYIYVKGKGDKPIELGTGLSVNWQSTIVWDNELNVFVLTAVNVLGFSLVKQMKPACKICFVK
jgi:hypothetical protein